MSRQSPLTQSDVVKSALCMRRSFFVLFNPPSLLVKSTDVHRKIHRKKAAIENSTRDPTVHGFSIVARIKNGQKREREREGERGKKKRGGWKCHNWIIVDVGKRVSRWRLGNHRFTTHATRKTNGTRTSRACSGTSTGCSAFYERTRNAWKGRDS